MSGGGKARGGAREAVRLRERIPDEVAALGLDQDEIEAVAERGGEWVVTLRGSCSFLTVAKAKPGRRLS